MSSNLLKVQEWCLRTTHLKTMFKLYFKLIFWWLEKIFKKRLEKLPVLNGTKVKEENFLIPQLSNLNGTKLGLIYTKPEWNVFVAVDGTETYCWPKNEEFKFEKKHVPAVFEKAVYKIAFKNRKNFKL